MMSYKYVDNANGETFFWGLRGYKTKHTCLVACVVVFKESPESEIVTLFKARVNQEKCFEWYGLREYTRKYTGDDKRSVGTNFVAIESSPAIITT